MITIMIVLFVLGYIGIASEHIFHVNKATFALIMCGVLWAIYAMCGHDSNLSEDMILHLGDTCEIVVFLIGAMTIVELIDRYGDPPPSVSDLVNVSLVRVQAAAVGVYEVTQKKDTLVLNLETLDLAMIRGLLQAFNGRVTAGAGTKPYLSVVLQPDEKPLELLQNILKAMDAILNNKEQNA